MSWFVFVVRPHRRTGLARDRDAILAYLRNHHIGCSNYFPPIHLQPFYIQEHGFKKATSPSPNMSPTARSPSRSTTA